MDNCYRFALMIRLTFLCGTGFQPVIRITLGRCAEDVLEGLR